MSNINTEKSLRDRYFDNEIYLTGDIVEDVTTGQQMKIVDRGANYITVATSDGMVKKWLKEVKEVTLTEETKQRKDDFNITESGQIVLFGYDTKNLDKETSELLIEQFSEFDDLYSQHQIVKCLDLAIQENDTEHAYSLLQKIEGFYSKHSIGVPFIVEGMKNDIERRRITEILAAVAEIKPSKSNYQTVVDSIKALKEKYQTRKQWEVLWPFFKLAKDAGLMGIMQNLPFNFSTEKVSEETISDNIITETLEDNIDLLVEDLDFEDIAEAFEDDDYSDALLTETLSIETRNKMSRKLKQHSPMITIRRERALSRSASTSVLLQRARKLAETMLKRRIFHKPASDMTRQEKERFESGIPKRKALVARLAQKLVAKVRMLQTARLHHNTSPVSHTHDVATSNIGAA